MPTPPSHPPPLPPPDPLHPIRCLHEDDWPQVRETHDAVLTQSAEIVGLREDVREVRDDIRAIRSALTGHTTDSLAMRVGVLESRLADSRAAGTERSNRWWGLVIILLGALGGVLTNFISAVFAHK